jgi:hypothetical protein
MCYDVCMPWGRQKLEMEMADLYGVLTVDKADHTERTSRTAESFVTAEVAVRHDNGEDWTYKLSVTPSGMEVLRIKGRWKDATVTPGSEWELVTECYPGGNDE